MIYPLLKIMSMTMNIENIFVINVLLIKNLSIVIIAKVEEFIFKKTITEILKNIVYLAIKN